MKKPGIKSEYICILQGNILSIGRGTDKFKIEDVNDEIINFIEMLDGEHTYEDICNKFPLGKNGYNN